MEEDDESLEADEFDMKEGLRGDLGRVTEIDLRQTFNKAQFSAIITST